jgi:serine-type D-Ala-D-Ala carboxypeptidase
MRKSEDAIAGLLERARAQYVFSGYQFHGEGPSGTLSLHGGMLSHWHGSSAVSPSSLFDIGSVTKAVATTSLLALAVDRGDLSLDDKISTHVRELEGTKVGALDLGAVSSHSAGLEAWLPVGLEANRGELLAWFKREDARVCARPPGEKAVYSDVGFLLLGLVLETKVGPLGEIFKKQVAEPLGLTEVRFGPVPAAGCAATEFHLESRRVLQGEVFDDNCRQLGGTCAHAGLFATARGLAPWAKEWLSAVKGKSRWIRSTTAKHFTARSNRAPGSSWAFGWDTRSEAGSSAGSRFSLSSFGHLGYPGCSVWIDPEGGHFAVFNTNRVHPSRLDERIRQVRPALHDAWAEFCGSK